MSIEQTNAATLQPPDRSEKRDLPPRPIPPLTACALIHYLLDRAAGPDQSFTGVTLTGPADFVFDGQIEV